MKSEVVLEDKRPPVSGVIDKAFNDYYKKNHVRIRNKNKILRAAKMKSLDEIVNAVGKYEKYDTNLAYIFSWYLAWSTYLKDYDDDRILKIAKFMSLDGIVDVVGGYKDNVAPKGFWNLLYSAFYDGDKNIVKVWADTIAMYKRSAAVKVSEELYRLVEEADYGDDHGNKYKKEVLDIGKTLQSDEIIRVIDRYKANIKSDIIESLSDIYKLTHDKDKSFGFARVISQDKIVNIIQKYDIDVAEKTLDTLSLIYSYTGDGEVILEFANKLEKYGGKDVDNALDTLEDVISYVQDSDLYYGDITAISNAITPICHIMNKVDRSIQNISETLKPEEFMQIHNEGLDTLIENNDHFDAVAAYVRSNGKLPLPTKDNINEYSKIAGKYLSEIYGVKQQLNNRRLYLFFSLKNKDRKSLVPLVNNSYEKDRKLYSILIKDDEDRSVYIDRSRLPYLSVIAVIGSRDPAIENEAIKYISKIVGEKEIRIARNSFNSKYKSKRKEIVDYIRKDDIDSAIKTLKVLNDETISDVLMAADYRDEKLHGKYILSAVESNNPLDYDSKVQMACVYLPEDFKEGIHGYCKDYYSEGKEKGFTLVRYDIGGKALGSAICYMEKDSFLVDSVEGHRVFRKPEIFFTVYQDLVGRARSKGARRIIFNKDVSNETAKDFIDYLDKTKYKLGLNLEVINVRLDTAGYIESSEESDGYTLNL